MNHIGHKMDNDTTAFYDAIAEYYPMFYKDWEVQLEREGLGLRSVFRGKGVINVLDAACGAGTQAIPLAELGYEVVAVDPSAGMLAKAKQLAKEHNVQDKVTFIQSDFDSLTNHVQAPFDAIVCKGNALPHLIHDEDIENALLTFFELLRPGGVLVLGMRDFEYFLEHRPTFLPGFHHITDDNEFITYEIWEWRDGPPVITTQNLYITKGTSDNLTTIKRSVTFRPLSVEEVQVVLSELNFEDVSEYPDRWEQVLIARRPLGS
jgi:glycine/sarcosine N-methyltransferase